MPQATRSDAQSTLEAKGKMGFKNPPWLTEHLLRVSLAARFCGSDSYAQREGSTNNHDKNNNGNTHVLSIYHAPGTVHGVFYSVALIQFFRVGMIIHVFGKVKQRHLSLDSFTQRTLLVAGWTLRMYRCREQKLSAECRDQ